MDLAAAKLIISDPTKTITDQYKAAIAIVNDGAADLVPPTGLLLAASGARLWLVFEQGVGYFTKASGWVRL